MSTASASGTVAVDKRKSADVSEHKLIHSAAFSADAGVQHVHAIDQGVNVHAARGTVDEGDVLAGGTYGKASTVRSTGQRMGRALQMYCVVRTGVPKWSQKRKQISTRDSFLLCVLLSVSAVARVRRGVHVAHV